MLDLILFVISLLYFILGIVLIIKFFEITKNIKEIKEILVQGFRKSNPEVTINPDASIQGIQTGSHIVDLKTVTQMKVMEILNENGIMKFVCSPNNGITKHYFERSEIELFNTYFNKKE